MRADSRGDVTGFPPRAWRASFLLRRSMMLSSFGGSDELWLWPIRCRALARVCSPGSLPDPDRRERGSTFIPPRSKEALRAQSHLTAEPKTCKEEGFRGRVQATRALITAIKGSPAPKLGGAAGTAGIRGAAFASHRREASAVSRGTRLPRLPASGPLDLLQQLQVDGHQFADSPSPKTICIETPRVCALLRCSRMLAHDAK